MEKDEGGSSRSIDECEVKVALLLRTSFSTRGEAWAVGFARLGRGLFSLRWTCFPFISRTLL
jgi:hypothetical protein